MLKVVNLPLLTVNGENSCGIRNEDYVFKSKYSSHQGYALHIYMFDQNVANIPTMNTVSS